MDKLNTFLSALVISILLLSQEAATSNISVVQRFEQCILRKLCRSSFFVEEDKAFVRKVARETTQRIQQLNLDLNDVRNTRTTLRLFSAALSQMVRHTQDEPKLQERIFSYLAVLEECSLSIDKPLADELVNEAVRMLATTGRVKSPYIGDDVAFKASNQNKENKKLKFNEPLIQRVRRAAIGQFQPWQTAVANVQISPVRQWNPVQSSPFSSLPNTPLRQNNPSQLSATSSIFSPFRTSSNPSFISNQNNNRYSRQNIPQISPPSFNIPNSQPFGANFGQFPQNGATRSNPFQSQRNPTNMFQANSYSNPAPTKFNPPPNNPWRPSLDHGQNFNYESQSQSASPFLVQSPQNFNSPPAVNMGQYNPPSPLFGGSSVGSGATSNRAPTWGSQDSNTGSIASSSSYNTFQVNPSGTQGFQANINPPLADTFQSSDIFSDWKPSSEDFTMGSPTNPSPPLFSDTSFQQQSISLDSSSEIKPSFDSETWYLPQSDFGISKEPNTEPLIPDISSILESSISSMLGMNKEDVFPIQGSNLNPKPVGIFPSLNSQQQSFPPNFNPVLEETPFQEPDTGELSFPFTGLTNRDTNVENSNQNPSFVSEADFTSGSQANPSLFSPDSFSLPQDSSDAGTPYIMPSFNSGAQDMSPSYFGNPNEQNTQPLNPQPGDTFSSGQIEQGVFVPEMPNSNKDGVQNSGSLDNPASLDTQNNTPFIPNNEPMYPQPDNPAKSGQMEHFMEPFISSMLNTNTDDFKSSESLENPASLGTEKTMPSVPNTETKSLQPSRSDQVQEGSLAMQNNKNDGFPTSDSVSNPTTLDVEKPLNPNTEPMFPQPDNPISSDQTQQASSSISNNNNGSVQNSDAGNNPTPFNPNKDKDMFPIPVPLVSPTSTDKQIDESLIQSDKADQMAPSGIPSMANSDEKNPTPVDKGIEKLSISQSDVPDSSDQTKTTITPKINKEDDFPSPDLSIDSMSVEDFSKISNGKQNSPQPDVSDLSSLLEPGPFISGNPKVILEAQPLDETKNTPDNTSNPISDTKFSSEDFAQINPLFTPTAPEVIPSNADDISSHDSKTSLPDSEKSAPSNISTEPPTSIEKPTVEKPKTDQDSPTNSGINTSTETGQSLKTQSSNKPKDEFDLGDPSKIFVEHVLKITTSTMQYMQSPNFNLDSLCAMENQLALLVNIAPLDVCSEIAMNYFLLHVLEAAIIILKH